MWPARPRQLAVITSPPGEVTAGALFETDIAIEDSLGNVEPAFDGNVTIALANKPGGVTLGGTLTVAAVDGLAAFPGLTLSTAGSGYTLQATASGLTSTTTSAFNVTPAGVATQLVVTTEPPSSSGAGGGFGLVVKAEDGSGTLDTSFNGNVTVADSSGATVGGTLTPPLPAAQGVATFSGLTEDLATPSTTLSVTSAGLIRRRPSSFAVTAGRAN